MDKMINNQEKTVTYIVFSVIAFPQRNYKRKENTSDCNQNLPIHIEISPHQTI